jgi:cell division protease FtsH
LELKTKNVPLEDDVDLAEIAKATPGFSGAHLDNLVNEAAMLAARRDASKVAADDFDEARDKVMMGPARSVTIDDDERRRLAVHEAGHTSAAHYLEHADTPMKVTVVPRGQALGGTHQVPERESYTMAEDELHDRLVALLAGRASERLFLGTVSSGADDDIQKATQLARAMVGRWGMDEDVGPVDVRVSEENPFLGYEMTHRRPFSDQTAAAVDAGVKKLLVNAQKRAAELLETHRDRIDALAQELAREETVTKDRIAELLGDRERSSEQSAAAE